MEEWLKSIRYMYNMSFVFILIHIHIFFHSIHSGMQYLSSGIRLINVLCVSLGHFPFLFPLIILLVVAIHLYVYTIRLEMQ